MKNNNHVIAEQMINQYGSRALLEAMFRIDHSQADNNQASVAEWSKIADAIERQLMTHSLIESSVH